MYVCMYVCSYVCMYAGLEISGIASPNANRFYSTSESLRQSDSPNFFGTANHFRPIANHFSNGFAIDLF